MWLSRAGVEIPSKTGNGTVFTFPTSFSSIRYSIAAMTSTGAYFAETTFGYNSLRNTSCQIIQYNIGAETSAALSAKIIVVGY